jgi:3-oxoacyl-[acyl-carrier-protein] synthase III
VNLAAVAIKQGAMHAAHVLRERGWLDGRVDHLIMHQTSESALKGALRELNGVLGATYFDAENTIFNVAERGNTASTSHFVALHDHIASGRIQSGDRVVFGISASGQTTGTALCTLDDLPERLRSGRPAPKAQANGREDFARAAGSRPLVRIESLGTSRRSAECDDTLSLIDAAAGDCLQRSRHRRQDIDLVTFAGVYRSEYLSEPAVAALAAGRLGINDAVDSPASPRTLAFDIGSGATGFLHACQAASGLIASGRHKVALVTAAEIDVNRGIPDAPELGIREAGAAMVLEASTEGDSGFLRFHVRSFGEHVDRLETHTEMQAGHLTLHVKQDADWERFALQAMVETVSETLAAEGLAIEDIRLFLPSQRTSSFVASAAEALGISPSACVDVAGEPGDLFTASLAYALREAAERGLARSGDLALLVEVGSGMQVACALYRF